MVADNSDHPPILADLVCLSLLGSSSTPLFLKREGLG